MSETATMDRPITIDAEVIKSEDKAKTSLAVVGNITIPAEVMSQATASLPDDQKALVRWYYYHSQTEWWTISISSEKLKLDQTTLYRIWTGKYEAKLDRICDRIDSYKRLWEERKTVTKAGFVPISVSQAVWNVCEYALVNQSVAMIYGRPQIGKTTALEEYTRTHNHGQTRFVRMPAAGCKQLMMREIAKACFISPDSSFDKLRDKVLKGIDGSNLLIVDEIHQAFLSYQQFSAITCLEVLREIHDMTKCGLVLCGTEVWEKELKRGSMKEMLAQLRLRGAVERKINPNVPMRDITAIAKAFSLETPTGDALATVRAMLDEWGLGRFVKYLQVTSRHAAKTKRRISWGIFLETHDNLSRVSES